MKLIQPYVYKILIALALPIILGQPFLPADAAETWEKLDKRLKTQVYQINVGLRLKFKNGDDIYLADLSPKKQLQVFNTTKDSLPFKVVGMGSTFPIKVRSPQTEKIFFLTNRHVVDGAQSMIIECRRFYSAMYLLAEQFGDSSVEQKFKQLQDIIALASKKNLSTAELATYQNTADLIWNAYDTYLSKKADPGQQRLQKYIDKLNIEYEVGYFMHAAGPSSQAAIEAQLYKVAQSDNEPDLAILQVASKETNAIPLEFDTLPASEGQEIQVVGYPVASDQIDADSGQYYTPTFNTGRISRVAPRLIQVDAPITTGNSGGPVISLRGKVLGVVALRAMSKSGSELSNFGGAITVESVRNFAPELFTGTATKLK